MDNIILEKNNIYSFMFDDYEFTIEYCKEKNLWIAIPYDADKFDYLIHIEGINEDDRYIGFNDVEGITLFNNYLLTKSKFEELKSLTI